MADILSRPQRGRIRDTQSCVFAGRNDILVVSVQGPRKDFSSVEQAPYSVPVPFGTATEDRGMKHLVNGVVIAAALAITAPVWAQTGAPMTASSRAPAGSAPAAA